MKFLAFALSLIAVPALAEPPAQADEQALLALAANADAAWDARDVDGMTALYEEGATLRMGGGKVVEGQQAIRTQFQSAFAARQATMRHVTTIDRNELIAPDLAISDAGVRVEQQQPDGSWLTVRSFRNVSLARRGPDGWRLRTVRAIPIQQP